MYTPVLVQTPQIKLNNYAQTGKTVRKNSKAVCDICDLFVYIKCGAINPLSYDEAVKSQSNILLVYNVCCLNAVPNIGMLDISRDDECNLDEIVDVSAAGTEMTCLTVSIREVIIFSM